MNNETIKTIHEEVSNRANNNSKSCVQDQIEILFNHRDFWSYREIASVGYKEFKTFLQYVYANSPWGLGWTEQMLNAYLLPEKEKLHSEIFSQLPALSTHGTNQHSKEEVIYNVLNRGDSRAYKLQRLKRDAPEYAEKVIRGELSANRAMVEAGLEKEKVTIPVDVNAFCNAIKRKFSPLEIQQLKDLL